MRLKRKESVVRFRMFVIALNIILASISLINLYTIAAGAVEVNIPDENDFAWTIDSETEEVSFFSSFTVTNHGLYDITDLNIHATVITERGNTLVEYSQTDLTIPSGDTKIFDIVAVLPFERIDKDEWRHLMINDSYFTLDVDIKADYLWGLSTFVVDDLLEYPWEAPLSNLDNETGPFIADLILYVISGDSDIDGFVGMLVDEVSSNPLVSNLEWEDASFRLESRPLGGNTSRVIGTLTLGVLGGRRTLICEFTILMEMEDDEYEITLESVTFDYQ